MSQEFFPAATEFDPKDVLKWIQFALAILPLFGVGSAALAPAISAMSNMGRGGIDVANTFMKTPWVLYCICFVTVEYDANEVKDRSHTVKHRGNADICRRRVEEGARRYC